jgi:uroporphyrinogen-III decarboxylase
VLWTGLNPIVLRKKYRGRIVFCGGPAPQYTLTRGTVADAKRVVEDLLEGMGEGGGFVLSSRYSIQPDVPMENILVMTKTVPLPDTLPAAQKS